MTDEGFRRHPRRSHPNLQLFSVTQLTSVPLTDHDDEAASRLITPKSYIASHSLPQTPSILSRSNSRSRQNHKLSSKSSHAIPDLPETADFQPKTTRSRHHSRTNSARAKVSSNNDWLMQTASALSLSTAESKGQSWLAARASSTSLANVPYEHHPPESAYRADDEFSPVSFRHSSRPQSRLGSRFASRRGSKVGLMTPVGFRTPGERDEQAGYFDNMSIDLVENESDDDDAEEDDNEVKKLVVGRVGGWVDWAVGWMDFRAEDDHLDEVPEEDLDLTQGMSDKERRKRKQTNRERERAKEGTVDVVPAPAQADGLLSDAAWLFGVAKSSIA